LEEGQMKRCTRYLLIAALSTILDAAVNVYSGMTIWKAWSEDIWGCGRIVFLAALGATSLANVWAQAVTGLSDSVKSRSSECEVGATPIPPEARGYGDV